MYCMPASVIRFAAAITLIALLAACDSGRGSIESWVKEEQAKRGTPPPPPPAIKNFETVEYTAQKRGLRDPFDVGTNEEEQIAGSGPRPDENRPKEPLEAYPLDGLRMVGTLGAAAAPEGLLKDPEGVIHRVRPGNYLGQNYGRITSVAEDNIELVELVPNGTGGWMERQTRISLADANRQ